VQQYGKRHKRRIGEHNFKEIEQSYNEYCSQYLLEESVVMILLAKYGREYALYPAKQTAILEATTKLLIEPTYKNMLKWIPIRFKSVSEAANQDRENISANGHSDFFKVKKTEALIGHSLQNIESFVQITEQLNCFLKNLSTQEEKDFYVNFLIDSIQGQYKYQKETQGSIVENKL